MMLINIGDVKDYVGVFRIKEIKYFPLIFSITIEGFLCLLK